MEEGAIEGERNAVKGDMDGVDLDLWKQQWHVRKACEGTEQGLSETEQEVERMGNRR